MVDGPNIEHDPTGGVQYGESLSGIQEGARDAYQGIGRLTSVDYVRGPQDNLLIQELSSRLYGDVINETTRAEQLAAEAIWLRRLVAELLQQNLALNSRLAEVNELSEHQAERIFNLQHDALTSAMRVEGLADFLESAEGAEARSLIEQGRAAVTLLDLRGLKLINDRIGYDRGDRFIAESGREIGAIVDHVGRFNPRPGQEQATADQPERRAGQSLPPDILIRWGLGDEFVIIHFGVEPDQMERLASQIEAPLSIESALERAERGEIPFISSVGVAHLAEITEQQRQTARSRSSVYADYPPAVIAVLAAKNVADEQQKIHKQLQYAQMRGLVEAKCRRDKLEIPPQPSDDREQMNQFLDICASDWLRGFIEES